MSDTIQVVELGDALRAIGRCLQQWVDDGMPQEDPEVVAIPFEVPASDVIELTERMVGQGDPVWPAKFWISEMVPVDSQDVP